MKFTRVKVSRRRRMVDANRSEFLRQIVQIAMVAHKPSAEVMALWTKYSKICYGRATLLWEFVQAYSKELGGDTNALIEASF